jgi:hypothetical protein
MVQVNDGSNDSKYRLFTPPFPLSRGLFIADCLGKPVKTYATVLFIHVNTYG